MMTSGGLARELYRRVLEATSKLIGPKNTKWLDALIRFRRKINLKNPKTLADKISWLEFNGDQALIARCTDKIAVREYVTEKGLGSILIPLCGGPWVNPEEIDINVLPTQFVLKATHGCEMNYICQDKAQLDVEEMMSNARKWLNSEYSRACVEPHYKLIPHQLFAEEYVGGKRDTIDYKIHCINGVPKFILTCSNRGKSLKLNLYDTEWQSISGLQGPMKNDIEIPSPNCLKRMIKISEELASEFDFVRVDLYEKDGKVYFGELTFTPAVGILPYFTDDFITYWGKMLHLSRVQTK